ncbi:flavin monoamine oxidase family protein [Pseudonocardia spinosispora]|uniref:flavin monoamine oxidase family protein n=1 Tax=Pseudonocardia spinosispora TaxID=103441 RepID=UPI000411DA0C|nr:flavin monoamine oxidase family protein [Pseudonocardia spinosispora]
MSESEGSGVTRRRFLRAVGVTGGAGAMFATMGALDLAATDTARPRFEELRPADFHLSGRSAAKVVILGGGVAGLACAYELGKAGYDCTILEAQNRFGGRNFTVRGGTTHTEIGGMSQRSAFSTDQYLNAGPGRIAQWMVTMDYCRELGVPLEVFNNTNIDAYIYREKNGAKPGFPVRRRAAKADVYGYVSELLAKATDQGALDKQLNPEDKEKLLDFLRDWGDIGKKVPGNPEKSWIYDGSNRRGYTQWPGATGSHAVRSGPVPTLSQVLHSEVGLDLSFENEYKDAMVMMQPVGGMDQIPQALAKRVGADRIKLGCVVTKVSTGADHVQVSYREGGQDKMFEADYCIATLPPNLMVKVPNNFAPGVQRALNAYKQVNAGKIGLEYRSRWWEITDRIYGGITETDLDLDHIWYPSHGYHSPRGVLVGYYNLNDRAANYSKLTAAAREARAVSQGAKIHGPKYRTELASSFSIDWSRSPYIEGAWQKIQDDDPELPIYAPLSDAAGRVYFSGDWLSHTVSWQHGAFLSAQKTVTQIHKRALSAA